MSLLIRRIVLLVIAVVLPLHGWGAALPVCENSMKVRQTASELCCAEMQHCSDTDSARPSHGKASDVPCQLKPGCSASVLYQITESVTPVSFAPIATALFVDFTPNLLTANHPPLWRPPALR